MLKFKKTPIIIISLALCLIVFVGDLVFYRIFYLITISFVLSILWSILSYKKIDASQRVDKTYCYTGEEINIFTTIINDSIFPIPFIQVDNIISFSNKFNSKFFSLMPLENIVIENKMKFKYRGIYKMGPIKIKLSDVFGIVTLKKTINIDKKIDVYPKVYFIENISMPNIRPLGIHISKINTNEDFTSIRNIRKYNVGDNLKKIHWKLTAKRGELYVKEFNLSGSNSVYILLDMSNVYETKQLEETAVEATISIVEYLLRNRVETILYILSDRLYTIDGKSVRDFDKFNKALITIKAGGKIDIFDIIKGKFSVIDNKNTIYFITGNISDRKENILQFLNQLPNLNVISCDESSEKYEGIKYLTQGSQIKEVV